MRKEIAETARLIPERSRRFLRLFRSSLSICAFLVPLLRGLVLVAAGFVVCQSTVRTVMAIPWPHIRRRIARTEAASMETPAIAKIEQIEIEIVTATLNGDMCFRLGQALYWRENVEKQPLPADRRFSSRVHLHGWTRGATGGSPVVYGTQIPERWSHRVRRDSRR